MLVLKLVIKIINKKKVNDSKFKTIQTKFIIVFIIEFISMIPSFIISAISRVLISCSWWSESIEKCFQILFLYVSLISIAIYFVKTVSKN